MTSLQEVTSLRGLKTNARYACIVSVIVVRDDEGNILHYEETTFKEVDGRTIVIGEPTPSPSPP